MSTPDVGRLTFLIVQDIGWDVAGLLQEAEKIPGEILSLREQIAPLKSELRMREAKYASKGRSPSHYDIQRSVLISKLKEEARQAYNQTPDFRTDAKTGREVKIELTDGRAEDVAHAHDEYKAFVKKASAEQRRMDQIGRLLNPLFNRIEELRGRKEYLSQRLGIVDALIRAWGNERRST